MDEQYMKMRNIATSVAYSPNVTEFLNESSDERVIHMENIEDIFLNSYLLDSDIAEITMALSRIFRFATKGEEIVKVEDELRYVQEYAKIIENAVFHGLEQKIEEGEVVVSVCLMKENMMQFVAEDNGCGMEKEQIEQLWQTMQKHIRGKRCWIGECLSEVKAFLRRRYAV